MQEARRLKEVEAVALEVGQALEVKVEEVDQAREGKVDQLPKVKRREEKVPRVVEPLAEEEEENQLLKGKLLVRKSL